MAVLAEAISVIVRAEPLLQAFDEDFDAFKALVPNETLCADGELVRVGFMAPADAEAFIAKLAPEGLRHLVDDVPQDVTVVDQIRGPMIPTPWLEYGHVGWSGDPKKKVACCRLLGSQVSQLVTPDGWDYEQSLTASYLFVPEKAISTMTAERRDGGVERFRSPLSDKPYFLGQTEE
jgi:hypothetical protein